ncbi:related to STE6-ABC transporter [Sporisorium reilianum SRZ2]|uniref:Related to STE6-ABC transporter n=1 Tax=Sporisorium reilianum (strain SRZ2) TaxID=999809 RepID=E6ZPU7_SPORE|nr:related to STE6-ABC transporter [Sporisorium reilianum SRZ2]
MSKDATSSSKRHVASTSPTKPSIRLLFSFLTPRDVVLLLLPAILCSVVVGMVPTVMSKVVGKAFDAFSSYNPTSQPAAIISAATNHHFLHKILSTVYVLLALSAVTFCISTVSVSAWICLAERTAARVRTAVFASVMAKKTGWFDTGMGLRSDDADQVEISPAGLMTKVARECDDMRIAVSRELGNMMQHLTTAVASLVLALYTSWSLTLVILASIPAVLVLTVVTEIGAAPSLQRERMSTTHATSMVERVVDAVNTVKAFNAQARETERFERELKRGCRSYRRTLLWWSVRFGVTSGLVFATFVQGFWFGSHLVRKGKITPGEVMTVFMSSLLVSSTLNEIMQALSYIDKGKVGAANLINLINSSDTTQNDNGNVDRSSHLTTSPRSSNYTDDKTSIAPTSPSSNAAFAASMSLLDVLEYDPRRARAVPMSIDAIPATPSPGLTSPDTFTRRPHAPTPLTRLAKRSGVQNIRRISPPHCQGEVHLRSVCFHYPARPLQRVLDNVHLYFAPAEHTYVVGGSGSGKSTIAHLLLRLYEPTAGTIQIDDQTVEFLDPHWCRVHIGAVSQDPMVFDMSVHDNVALGLVGKVDAEDGVPRVAREDVEAACRLAMLHEFVRDLPDGYETVLGAKGTALSGGQRQRLAIARARLRDPSILILDEATSALDPTTRHLVHEAIKTWRRGKTTIIITHDLSQIQSDDFLYLLDSGRVVQQGYRSDLEAKDGPFQKPALQQSQAGEEGHARAVEQIEKKDRKSKIVEPTHDESYTRRRRVKYSSMLGWEREGGVLSEHLSLIISQKIEGAPSHLKPLRLAERQAMNSYWQDAETLKATGSTASNRRARNGAVERRRWDAQPSDYPSNETDQAQTESVTIDTADDEEPSSKVPTMRQVCRILWRTIPSRTLLLVGLLICVLSGTLTPVFSYILAQLLATMGRTDQSGTVLKWSLLILLIALLEGIFAFGRYLFMEVLADSWLYRLRTTSYHNVLQQDRAFFDRRAHTPARVCQSIVKDGEDARNLVGQILGQLALIATMISLGIGWALVVGWKLTLAGVAFGPVFLAAIALQSRIISVYEVRNKHKREAVAHEFHAMVAHMRSIRAMGLERVFERAHARAVHAAQRCGMRASVFAGFGHGMSDALTYIAEALIFYVGARLMVTGEYSFGRMMQVFNLIIFAVTFAAQMLTFLPGLSKSVQPLADLDRLVRLSDASTDRTEAKGELESEVRGRIEFCDVGFAYDARAGQVLDGMRFEVARGECVAIVGASGCGKSTVAALLQRLYEPTSGTILLDGTPLSTLSTHWLREHISVVGQTPALFDLTIADNIAYGANDAPTQPRIEAAARAANAHTFISALPHAYATQTTGTKLSGGQAQRLAIARALMRTRAPILVLDECTSALDVDNQRAIVDTLLSDDAEVRKRRMTTLVITHNVDMMRRCDRILVVKGGKVVEQGSYAELVRKAGGYFASLSRGGEWTG